MSTVATLIQAISAVAGCNCRPSYVRCCNCRPSYVRCCNCRPCYVSCCNCRPCYVNCCDYRPSYVRCCKSHPSYVSRSNFRPRVSAAAFLKSKRCPMLQCWSKLTLCQKLCYCSQNFVVVIGTIWNVRALFPPVAKLRR